MTLPASGPISASMINAELGRDTNARFHINGAAERALAEVPTGLVTFADFYGKSAGSFTPQVDYPDPSQIDMEEEYPGALVNIVASISFNSDGTITIQGTPTETFPDRWYINGPVPPDTRILIALLGSVQTGETGEITSVVANNTNWQSIAANPSAFVKVNSSVAPVIASGIAASYSIAIALNGQLIVQFATSLTAEFTIPP